MMNFRKIAAASKGRLILRYFTENTPEPIRSPPVDAAGRQLEEGGRLTAHYTGRDSQATGVTLLFGTGRPFLDKSMTWMPPLT